MSHNDEQRYDFAPGERERTEREMADREARARHDETLAWARARAADRTTPKRRPAPTAAAPALGIKVGQLRHEMKAAEKRAIHACMAAVGSALVAKRARARAELETEVLKLRAEFLQAELDRERGTKRLRAAPPPALIA